MASVLSGEVARQVRTLYGVGSVAHRSDGDLLAQFVARGDISAFEALVVRHGPTVLRVCRDVLTDPNDADDAFQATFLVLLRRAGAIRKRASVGAWLYGVAYRVACKARVRASRRVDRERRAAESGRSEAFSESPGLAIDLGALHEEIDRLPEPYRAPIVLCYLEGLTHDQAAARLGWPVGTVRGRLARARDRLRDRLGRRGLAPSIALVGSRLSSLDLPARLVRSVTQFALSASEASGTVPAAVAALAEGALNAMIWTKARFLGLNLAAVGLLAAGTTLPAWSGDETSPGDHTPVAPTSSRSEGGGQSPQADDRNPEMLTRVYSVADLVYPVDVWAPLGITNHPKPEPEFDPLVDLITSSVAPETWGRQTGASIRPNKPDATLIIRQTPAVHEEIVQRLRQLRRLRGFRTPDEEWESRKAVGMVEPTTVPTTLNLDPAKGTLEVTGPARVRLPAPRENGSVLEKFVFPIGDLIWKPGGDPFDGDPMTREADVMVSLLTASVAPGTWRDHDESGRPRQATDPDLVGTAVVSADRRFLHITHRREVVARARAWLNVLRSLRGLKPMEPLAIPPQVMTEPVEVEANNAKVYFVQGDVARPAAIPLNGSETILDALNHAGGLTTEASNVLLVRAGDPMQTLQVDLQAIVGRGDATTNYSLKPGDRVVVYAEPTIKEPTEQSIPRRLDDQDQRLREIETKLDRLIDALDSSTSRPPGATRR